MSSAPALSVTASLLLVVSLSSPVQAPVARAAPYDVARNSLELDVARPRVVFEDAWTHFTGRLTSGQAGRLIVLRSESAGRWRPVATTRTDGDGSYTFDLRPVNPTTLRLQALHPRHRGALRSVVREVRVLDRHVTLTTRSSYETFGDVVVSGAVRPPQPDRHVVMQHLRDGRWISGADGYTDADGHYAIHMRNEWPGAWTVRAYWPGNRPADGTAEYSGVHHYTVRAVLHPVVTSVTRAQLGKSYHAGCPVGPAQLRNVTLTYKTFGPLVGRGTLVVRSTIVDHVEEVWGLALQRRFPIRKIFPTAHYGGSDVASMYHDNTSAFNCRHVTGDPTKLSPHSYGVALDIDPVENPYQDVHGTWWPRTIGERYRNRGHAYPGMLYSGSAVTKALRNRGFRWGGYWSHPDYQHFDTFSDKGSGSPPGSRDLGGLTQARLPAPALLGKGWAASSLQQRNAADAGAGVLPIGCAGRAREGDGPVDAVTAGQATYRSAGGLGTAQLVALEFATDGGAAAYFERLSSVLSGCRIADGPAGESTSPQLLRASSYAGERHLPGSDTWHELDERVGKRVVVLLSSSPIPDAAALRASLRHGLGLV